MKGIEKSESENTPYSKYYYEIHVSDNRYIGYSIFLKSSKKLDDDEIIKKACHQNRFIEPEDANYVDYVDEINEAVYNETFK